MGFYRRAKSLNLSKLIVPGLSALILFGAVDSRASFLGILCAKLAGRAPSSYQWKVRLDEACVVRAQGTLGTCWAQSMVDVFSKFMRDRGLIGTKDSLSADYYIAVHIHEQILNWSRLKKQEISIGASSTDFARLIQEYGVVLESDYRFPKLSETGKRVDESVDAVVSIVNDIEKTIKLELNPTLVTRYYFGDLNSVAKKISPNDMRLMNLKGGDSLYPDVFMGTRNSPQSLEIQNLDKLLKIIRENLDRGYPVHSTWYSSEVLKNTLDTYGNYFKKNENRNVGTKMHGMLIVGYSESKDGKIEHLLVRNSWGKSFGELGLMVADLHFFQKYIYSISQLGAAYK